jgi:hypothetical protein
VRLFRPRSPTPTRLDPDSQVVRKW